MGRRAQMAGILLAIAGALAFPSASSAGPADGGACATGAVAAQQQPSCAGCKPALTASGDGDTDPGARVAVTPGSEVTLKIRLNRGCSVPKGARMRIMTQKLDAAGKVTSRGRLLCGRSIPCKVRVTRTKAARYRYIAIIIGCRRAKDSKPLTVVWASPPPPVVLVPTPVPTLPPAGKVTMRFSAVTYQSPPTDPACTAPLPGGSGASSASYNHPDGNYNQAWKWNVPSEITDGATATIEASTNSHLMGGTSAGIGIRTPREFGLEPPNTDIEARVPSGQAGSDHNDATYAFHPLRDFTAGEKLYILILTGCAGFAYEYTGV